MKSKIETYKLIAQESKASQDAEELEWLLKKVGDINPKIIIEIGVHQGYSIETWSLAFRPDLIIGVEIDPHSLDYDRFELFEGNSHDVKIVMDIKRALNGRKVDFLFIDADHSYQGVKDDFELYKPFVRKGGIIAFDDMDLFGHPLVQVYNFWDEIKSKYKHEFIHKNGNGIGVLYV